MLLHELYQLKKKKKLSFTQNKLKTIDQLKVLFDNKNHFYNSSQRLKGVMSSSIMRLYYVYRRIMQVNTNQ